ncbi:hypothetical protein EFP6CSP_15740, partial [Enterococcus faecium]
FDQSINQSKITKNLSQNEVHSDPDLILYNPSVLIDKEPNYRVFLKSIRNYEPFIWSYHLHRKG